MAKELIPPEQPPVSSGDRLPRTLTQSSAIALVIGITIGSGIFRSPAAVAQHVPHAAGVLALWLAGGLISLCGALSFAELAAAFPSTGGYYVYLREAWGRSVAFLFGWAQLVVIRASALGGLAIVCAEYAWRAAGIDPGEHVAATRAAGAAVLALSAGVNIVGIDLAAAVVRMSTAAKLVALLAVIAAALVLGGQHGATLAHLTAGPTGPVTAGSVGLGLVSVLWAYDGFGDVSYAGGEVLNARRTLPRAIILGTTAIVVLYMLANVAYLYVNAVDGVAASPLVAAETMTAVAGRSGAALVSLFVAVSAFGALHGIMLASPRLFFAMAEDGLFFRRLARVHPRFRTPDAAILTAAALGMLLVASRSFEAMTATFVIAVWPFYGLCVAGVYRLRRTRPDLMRPYRTWGSSIIPAIFIAVVVWFVANALVNNPWPTGLTFALILAGLPVYLIAFRSVR